MRKITPTHNLEALHPDIASQWHPTKNNGISPSEIAPYSNKKYWWICAHGHDWDASASSRHRAGCPRCYEQKHQLMPTKKLSDSPKIFSELLQSQENYEGLKNSYINSTKKAQWKCTTCGDVWQTQIRKRTAEGQGCPYCAEKKVAPSKWNALSTKFPHLLKEWDFEKNVYSPDDELSGSHHYAYWKCSRGHSWRCEIRQRTISKSTCPKCSYQISKPQKRIYSELSYIFPGEVELSHKVNGIEIDIYLKKINIGIEYDGSFYHRSEKSKIRDRDKFHSLKNIGIPLIRVRALGLNEIEGVPCILETSEDSVDTIKNILKLIIKKIEIDDISRLAIASYLNISTFINQSLYEVLLLDKRVPLIEKSLAYTHPHLVDEWSSKNFDSPNSVTSGIHEDRKWICPNCHREFEASVYSRAKLQTGCGYCSGRYPTDKYNLLTEFPHIAHQLHPKKNSKKATEILPKSNDKLWWICENGHEYEMIVGNRTDKGQGCKICKKRVISEQHNLMIKSPELSKWFDTEKNSRQANEIMPNARFIAFWRCPNGHTWERRVDHQVRSGLVCQECKKLDAK